MFFSHPCWTGEECRLFVGDITLQPNLGDGGAGVTYPCQQVRSGSDICMQGARIRAVPPATALATCRTPPHPHLQWVSRTEHSQLQYEGKDGIDSGEYRLQVQTSDLRGAGLHPAGRLFVVLEGELGRAGAEGAVRWPPQGKDSARTSHGHRHLPSPPRPCFLMCF